MEKTLTDIIRSEYKYRIEFTFGDDYYINLQPNNGSIGRDITVCSNYPPLMKTNDLGHTFVNRIDNAAEAVLMFHSLPKEGWKRIKIKFYGSNFSRDSITRLRMLLKDFVGVWRPIALDRGAKFEWNVSDGLFDQFADEWNYDLI